MFAQCRMIHLPLLNPGRSPVNDTAGSVLHHRKRLNGKTRGRLPLVPRARRGDLVCRPGVRGLCAAVQTRYLWYFPWWSESLETASGSSKD